MAFQEMGTHRVERKVCFRPRYEESCQQDFEVLSNGVSSADAYMTGPEGNPVPAFYDKHSTSLFLTIGILLFLYSSGMMVMWYASLFDLETALSAGLILVALPTEVAILTSLNPRWCGFVLRRTHFKTHSTWLLLNELFRFFVTIDMELATVAAFTPALIYFAPGVAKAGVITPERIGLVAVEMAILAFFALIYGRSIMQVVGMGYETFRGGSLSGAAAYGSMAQMKFENERPSGLGYLSGALGHVRSALAARKAELASIDEARLAIRSFEDGGTKMPFTALRSLSEQLVAMPRLLDLPDRLKEFLGWVRWPAEIKPVRRRTYGVEWLAAVATVSGAAVTLIASLVQASGQSPLTSAIVSPVTPLVLLAIGLFFVALFLHFQYSTYYSVNLMDIDLLEKNEIKSAANLAGKRTTIGTLALFPRIIGILFFGFFAIGLGISLVILLLASAWHGGLIYYSPTVYVFSSVFAAICGTGCYIMARSLWYEFRPKKRQT